jgi:CDP-diacylglycerol--glycerol-3-phosphate 3-phosphatidyltransferase
MIDGHRGQSTASGTEDAAGEDQAVPTPEPVPPARPAPKPPERDLRKGFAIGARLARHGVTANEVTVVGMALAGATGVVIGLGQFWIAIVLLTVGGLMDTLDGAVAKAAGTASKKGAFFDSVADRVSDAFIFGGVAWYFASGSQPRLALLPFAILGVSTVISYERAKAESLGYDARGGLMERAERLIFLGVALLFHVVFVPLLGALLALTVFTAGQRFVKVWRQASPEAASSAAGRGPWRRGRVESRWQSWRQPRAGGTRRRATTPSRVRARRRSETLGVRLRRVLASERSGARRVGQRSEHRSLGIGSARRRHPGTDS